jgi:uncharacterized small protein (DUF1192 family)
MTFSLKKFVANFTAICFMAPTLSMANTNLNLASEMDALNVKAVEISAEAGMPQLYVKLTNRLEKNLKKLNKRFQGISNKRAEKIFKKMNAKAQAEGMELNFEDKMSAKERLLEMTSEKNITKAKEMLLTEVNSVCELEDRASECLNKLRHEVNLQASTQTKDASRAPASGFFCKLKVWTIATLFMLAGIVLIPFTVGISAPLLFVGFMFGIYFQDDC